jgi:hypothetical protein
MKIVPTKLCDYQPSHKKLTKENIALLNLAFGERKCSDKFSDILINYYLLAIVAVILFIVLSLRSIDNFLTNLIPNRISRLLFKAIIFFLIIYLLDRWLACWRSKVILCCQY